jgi:hypothetical protein
MKEDGTPFLNIINAKSAIQNDQWAMKEKPFSGFH